MQATYFLEHNWQPDKFLTFGVFALINIVSLRHLFQAELKGRGFTFEYRHLCFALFPPPVLTTFGAYVLLGDLLGVTLLLVQQPLVNRLAISPIEECGSKWYSLNANFRIGSFLLESTLFLLLLSPLPLLPSRSCHDGAEFKDSNELTLMEYLQSSEVILCLNSQSPFTRKYQFFKWRAWGTTFLMRD